MMLSLHSFDVYLRLRGPDASRIPVVGMGHCAGYVLRIEGGIYDVFCAWFYRLRCVVVCGVVACIVCGLWGCCLHCLVLCGVDVVCSLFMITAAGLGGATPPSACGRALFAGQQPEA